MNQFIDWLKNFVKRRFDQEGTLITIVAIVGTVVFIWFRSPAQRQDNKFKITGDNSTVIVNQQTHLSQGIYLRGSTAVTRYQQAEAGVFKEINSHLEIEIGGGIHNQDGRNSGFVSAGVRIKI